MQNKVSIIIPTYNRCHLLGETLDSIISQSYSNWECIVVDDASKDHTVELIEFYCKRDSRIKYYSRPQILSKGANSCRNYGFSKSSGDHIIWFDSDDLMTPDHIEEKVAFLGASNSDFIIAKTQNFNAKGFLEPYHYIKKPYGIRAADFILLKIHWYTYDVLLRREIAEKISWNEKMSSWQDYNYFCKMVLVSENGSYLDKVLTNRRLHSDSIQTALKRNGRNFQKELLENRIFTFEDINEQVDEETRRELVYGIMNLYYDLARKKTISTKWQKTTVFVKQELGKRSMVLFNLAIISAFLSGRGFSILEKAKAR